MNQTAMSLTLAGALALLQGCTFARIGVRNVPVFFKRPTHISQIGSLKASSGARVSATWIGHATVLLKIDDKFILTDPVFTSTIGGLSRRLVEPGISPSKMPVLDLVLISHRHLDHLSPASLELLGSRVQTVIVPPGAAKDFSRPSYAIMELSVGEQTSKADIRISAVRVLHTGGRIHDAKTHPDAFVGYVLECHGFTVYFPGDTTFQESIFANVAKQFRHIDLAIMPICPISPPSRMSRTHMNPAQAVMAAEMLGAHTMLPVHFETFINSLDRKEQCRDALKAATLRSVSTRVVPWHIGDSVELMPAN
jgi:L-ascorbate metabolism protein UlaG (beta-lactamase superfamily)